MRADYPNQLDYEGLPHGGLKPLARVELATPCLQGRCNNHYAKAAHGVKATGARFELTRAEPSRFRIYRLNHSAKMPCLWPKRWRIRVSIPVPRRCKRRTLPIELIPHVHGTKSDPGRTRTCNRLIRSQARYPLRHRAGVWEKKLVPVGFEPTPSDEDSNLSRAP